MEKKLIGVGGIGKGIFFESLTNETLGRNESRLMRRLPCKDYCKLHIVFHYAARFLSGRCRVLPVGCVGKDADGAELTALMRDAGMDLCYVQESDTLPTMLSICFQYPDKSGGNITSDNSACSELTTEKVLAACQDCRLGAGDFAVALPEVSLAARFALLREARASNAFCVASLAAEEADAFHESGVVSCCDLLAMNQEETARFAGISEVADLHEAERAASRILSRYPHLRLWLTVGAQGSVSADQTGMRRYNPLPVAVQNTGGAGDATLGGILAGLALGFPFQRPTENACWGSAPIASAAELGAILGGLSVECADSIDARLDMAFVNAFIQRNGWVSQF